MMFRRRPARQGRRCALTAPMAVLLRACVPPGMPHGPRIHEGTHVGVRVGNFVVDYDEPAPLPYLVQAFDQIVAAVGAYADPQEFLPPAAFAWWPSVGLEVRPRDRVTTSAYVGAAVYVDPETWEVGYDLQVGSSISGKLFD